MAPYILTAVFWFALLVGGAVPSAGDDDTIRLGKPDLALVVKLHIPGNEKYAAVWQTLEKLRAQGMTHWTLQAAKEGKAASAEVVAQPKTASSHVTAVVGVLLERGISRITVEVKK